MTASRIIDTSTTVRAPRVHGTVDKVSFKLVFGETRAHLATSLTVGSGYDASASGLGGASFGGQNAESLYFVIFATHIFTPGHGSTCPETWQR